jgi:hypothetical protein
MLFDANQLCQVHLQGRSHQVLSFPIVPNQRFLVFRSFRAHQSFDWHFFHV